MFYMMDQAKSFFIEKTLSYIYIEAKFLHSPVMTKYIFLQPIMIVVCEQKQ